MGSECLGHSSRLSYFNFLSVINNAKLSHVFKSNYKTNINNY